MSAKDIWEAPISSRCIYEWNMYTCKIPFSIRYDGITYDVEVGYRLNLEDEYLEIAEMTEPEGDGGFLSRIGQHLLHALVRKRILWSSITSIG